jgi:hypothetical protein
MDWYSPFMKNTALRFFLKKTWGKERELPVFAGKSYNKMKKKEKK